jgi:zinc protease
MSRGQRITPQERLTSRSRTAARSQHFRSNTVLDRINLPLIALAYALASSSLAADHRGPEIADFTLGNGLELVVIPDLRAPVVTHMIWYKVGAADETPGKSGLAHFLEHLMFKGTAKYPAGKFSRAVVRIGGEENAFTSHDYTGYFQRVPSGQLKTVMEFEADRMTGLHLADEVVLPERNVILEEQSERVRNDPHARLTEQVDAALYLNHPYGKPVIGWRHEIEQLSRHDAIGFYRRFYTPNNAVVVIAGDVSLVQVRALAEQTYAKIAHHSALAPRVRAQEPPPVAARSLTLADARVEIPSLQRGYLVPSFATGKGGESVALEVLAHILGGGPNSRLYDGLIVDKQVAVSASAWYAASMLDMSQFTIFCSPRPGVSLPQLEAEIDVVIAQLIDKGVTEEELEDTKTGLIADAVYAQDNQASFARWYGQALTTGASVNDVRNWPHRVRAVTANQVRDAARQWLDKRRSVTGYLIKDVSSPGEKRS